MVKAVQLPGRLLGGCSSAIGTGEPAVAFWGMSRTTEMGGALQGSTLRYGLTQRLS